MPTVSNEAVKEKTSRDWDEWFTLLDQEEADKLSHAEIARSLSERHGVDPWWAQNVTVEYEKARGLRVTGQNCDGEFYASGSKTIAASVERVFRAFEDAEERAAWLPEHAMRVRTATAPKSLRFDWEADGTRVNVFLTGKGPDKAQVSLQHEKLADAAEAERLKAFWRERLGQLKEHLEA